MSAIRLLLALTFICQTGFARNISLSCPQVLKVPRQELKKKFASGEALRKTKGLTATISDDTWNDLDFNDLVWPWLSKNVKTSFGRQNLYWSLRNLSLDADDIRGRQEAVSFFANNPKIRKTLLNLFDEMARDERAYVGSLQKVVGESLGNEIQTSKTGQHIDNALSFMAGYIPTLASASLIAVICASPSVGIRFSGAVAMLNSMFGQFTTVSRLQQLPYRGVFTAIDKIVPALSSSNVTDIRQIAEVLEGVNNSNISPELTRYAKFARGLMKDSLLARFIDVTGLTPNTATNQERLKQILPQVAIVLSALAELEVYVGLGELAAKGAAMPTILDGTHPFVLDIENGQHPFLYGSPGSVANSVHFDHNGDDQVLFLTGPNSRGKSTYLKMIGSLVILAQAGAPVPAASMTLTPMQILTNMKIADSVRERESTFRAEVKRLAKDINESNNYPNNLWLLDEAFSGTSPVEQSAAEQSFMEYILRTNGYAVIASHKRSLTNLEGQLSRFNNIHASDSDEMDRRYRIERGPSHRLNADQVMSEEGIPSSIVSRMRQLSHR